MKVERTGQLIESTDLLENRSSKMPDIISASENYEETRIGRIFLNQSKHVDFSEYLLPEIIFLQD